MNKVICPQCEAEHKSSGNFCIFCGTDLTEEILKFKEERLPISYNNGKINSKTNEKKEKFYCIPSKFTRFFFIALFSVSTIGWIFGIVMFIRNFNEITADSYFGVFIILLPISLILILIIAILESLNKTKGKRLCAPDFEQARRARENPCYQLCYCLEGIFDILRICGR